MSTIKRLPAMVILFLLANLAEAAVPADPLFQSGEMLDITLSGPFELIDRERNKDNEYDGSLSYVDASGAEVLLDASFQVRGNWRLDRRNCVYSQLWVDLRRGQLPGTLFENQNRLKLVVQCRRQDRYAEYVRMEQQLYEMFANLSEYNFDTRLVNVTYQDSEDPDESRTHIGFFIEHQNRIAERFGYEGVELHKVPNTELNALQGVVVSLFMYYIGNTDFSLIEGPTGEECCHNSKVIKSPAGEYFSMPYDFDASGYVDTNYAPEPNPAFNLRNNRDRLYRGFCVDREVLDEAVGLFQQQRARMLEIAGDTTYISQRSANRNIRYTEDFFEVLDEPRRFEREILDRCRG